MSTSTIKNKKLGEPYPFDEKFERAVAYLACTSRSFYELAGREVNPELLESGAAKKAIEAAHAIAKEISRGPQSPMLVLQRLRRWMSEGKVTLEQTREVEKLLRDAAEDDDVDENLVTGELVPILQRRVHSEVLVTAAQEYASRGDMNKVVDLIQRGARLGKRPDAASPVHVLRLSEVEPERVQWLWRGRIPLGKVTVIDGDPGLGKTTVTLDIAARLTTGQPMPGEQDARPPSDVVLITSEDGVADTIRPRIEAAGGDPSRVHVIDSILCGDGATRLPTLPDDIPAVEQVLREKRAVLLIVDPLMAALSGRVESGKDHNVRRALAPLAALAQKLTIAVGTIRHLNKGGATSGPTALYRGGGSIGIAAAARSVLLVAKDPDDPNARILASVKMNLACAPPALRFMLMPTETDVARIEWLGETECTADQLVTFQPPESRQERSRLSEACEFLQSALAEGPRFVAQVKKEAREVGVSDKTLERAKDNLGVRARKSKLEHGPWTWDLPRKEGRHGVDGDLGGDGDLGDLGRLGDLHPGNAGNGSVEDRQGSQDRHDPQGSRPPDLAGGTQSEGGQDRQGGQGLQESQVAQGGTSEPPALPLTTSGPLERPDGPPRCGPSRPGRG